MIRTSFLLSCFLLFSLNLFSQSKSPSEKIEYHLKLCKKYRESNQTKRFHHARKALSLAEKYGLKSKRAEALVKIGGYYFDRTEMDSAEFYINKGLLQFEKLGDLSGYAVALIYVSHIETYRGDYVKSFNALVEADSLFQLGNRPSRRIETNVSISTLLANQGEFEKAVLYLNRAKDIGTDDLYIKGVIHNNLAAYYGSLNDFDNSFSNANKSIEIKKTLNDKKGLSEAYINLAGILVKEKGPTEEAVRLINDALIGYRSIGNNHGVTKCHLSLGILSRMKREYDRSKEYLFLAEKEVSEIDHTPLKLKVKFAIYELYVELEDWENAYSYYADFKQLQDSLNSLEKTKIIQDLQTKYDTKELKRENELAKINEQLSKEKAKRSQNMSFLIFAIAAFCLIVILLIYLQYRQRKQKEVVELKLKANEKRLELEKQNRLSELKALQSQMNPHFVFNSLNSIQDLILQDDRINSIHYLGKLSELTRKILEQSSQELITLEEEIKMMKLYANLEKLRFGNELEFKITNQIPTEQSEEILLPTMFIQPYIENAFKHGLIHKEGEKTLLVNFQKDNEFILCTIEDNGVGRKKAFEISTRREIEHLNFSSTANAQRIELLNEQQENNIQLEVIDKFEGDKEIGTLVKIRFQPSIKQDI